MDNQHSNTSSLQKYIELSIQPCQSDIEYLQNIQKKLESCCSALLQIHTSQDGKMAGVLSFAGKINSKIHLFINECNESILKLQQSVPAKESSDETAFELKKLCDKSQKKCFSVIKECKKFMKMQTKLLGGNASARLGAKDKTLQLQRRFYEVFVYGKVTDQMYYELFKENSELKKEKKTLIKRNGKLKQECEDVKQQLEKSESSCLELKEQLQQSQQDYASKNQESQSMYDSYIKKCEENKVLASEYDEIKMERDLLEEECTKQQAKILSQQTKIIEQNKTIKGQEALVAQKVSQMSETQKERLETLDKINSLNATIQQYEAKIDNYKDNTNKLNEKLRKKDKEAESFKKTIVEYKALQQNLMQELDEARKGILAQQSDGSSSEEDLGMLNKTRKRFNTVVSPACLKCESVCEEYISLTNEVSQAKIDIDTYLLRRGK